MIIELDQEQESGKWGFWRGGYDLISPLWQNRMDAIAFALATSWSYQMSTIDPNQTVHFRLGDGLYAYVEMHDNQLVCTCQQFKHAKHCPHVRTVRNGGYVLTNQISPTLTPMPELIGQQQEYVYGVDFTDWCIINHRREKVSPEMPTSLHLWGRKRISDEPTHLGGSWDFPVMTSQLVGVTESGLIITKSGSRYRLNNILSEYAAFVNNAQKRLIKVLRSNHENVASIK